jgi:hypothetical protein
MVVIAGEQCCQVAEIPAKKLERGRRKKVGRKNLCVQKVLRFPPAQTPEPAAILFKNFFQ